MAGIVGVGAVVTGPKAGTPPASPTPPFRFDPKDVSSVVQEAALGDVKNVKALLQGLTGGDKDAVKTLLMQASVVTFQEELDAQAGSINSEVISEHFNPKTLILAMKEVDENFSLRAPDDELERRRADAAAGGARRDVQSVGEDLAHASQLYSEFIATGENPELYLVSFAHATTALMRDPTLENTFKDALKLIGESDVTHASTIAKHKAIFDKHGIKTDDRSPYEAYHEFTRKFGKDRSKEVARSGLTTGTSAAKHFRIIVKTATDALDEVEAIFAAEPKGGPSHTPAEEATIRTELADAQTEVRDIKRAIKARDALVAQGNNIDPGDEKERDNLIASNLEDALHDSNTDVGATKARLSAKRSPGIAIEIASLRRDLTKITSGQTVNAAQLERSLQRLRQTKIFALDPRGLPIDERPGKFNRAFKALETAMSQQVPQKAPDKSIGASRVTSNEFEMYEENHHTQHTKHFKKEFNKYSEWHPTNKLELQRLNNNKGQIYELCPTTGRLKKVKKAVIGKHYVIYKQKFGGSFHARVSHNVLRQDAISNLTNAHMLHKFNPPLKRPTHTSTHGRAIGGSFGSFFHSQVSKAKDNWNKLGKDTKAHLKKVGHTFKVSAKTMGRALKHPNMHNLVMAGRAGISVLTESARNTVGIANSVKDFVIKTPGLNIVNALARKIPVYGQALGLVEDGVGLMNALANSGDEMSESMKAAFLNQIVPMITHDVLNISNPILDSGLQLTARAIMTGDTALLEKAVEQVKEFGKGGFRKVAEGVVEKGSELVKAKAEELLGEDLGGIVGHGAAILTRKLGDVGIKHIEKKIDKSVTTRLNKFTGQSDNPEKSRDTISSATRGEALSDAPSLLTSDPQDLSRHTQGPPRDVEGRERGATDIISELNIKDPMIPIPDKAGIQGGRLNLDENFKQEKGIDHGPIRRPPGKPNITGDSDGLMKDKWSGAVGNKNPKPTIPTDKEGEQYYTQHAVGGGFGGALKDVHGRSFGNFHKSKIMNQELLNKAFQSTPFNKMRFLSGAVGGNKGTKPRHEEHKVDNLQGGSLSSGGFLHSSDGRRAGHRVGGGFLTTLLAPASLIASTADTALGVFTGKSLDQRALDAFKKHNRGGAFFNIGGITKSIMDGRGLRLSGHMKGGSLASGGALKPLPMAPPVGGISKPIDGGFAWTHPNGRVTGGSFNRLQTDHFQGSRSRTKVGRKPLLLPPNHRNIHMVDLTPAKRSKLAMSGVTMPPNGHGVDVTTGSVHMPMGGSLASGGTLLSQTNTHPPHSDLRFGALQEFESGPTGAVQQSAHHFGIPRIETRLEFDSLIQSSVGGALDRSVGTLDTVRI